MKPQLDITGQDDRDKHCGVFFVDYQVLRDFNGDKYTENKYQLQTPCESLSPTTDIADSFYDETTFIH